MAAQCACASDVISCLEAVVSEAVLFDPFVDKYRSRSRCPDYDNDDYHNSKRICSKLLYAHACLGPGISLSLIALLI